MDRVVRIHTLHIVLAIKPAPSLFKNEQAEKHRFHAGPQDTEYHARERSRVETTANAARMSSTSQEAQVCQPRDSKQGLDRHTYRLKTLLHPSPPRKTATGV